jgi:hypothetical protein
VSTITIENTGLVYRNPIPHVRSVHAYFPSVACLDNGDMLATVVLGEAFEAANLRTHLCRSTDGGETWVHEGPLYPGTDDRLTSDACRITPLPDGGAVAFMVRHGRDDYPNEGLSNADTLGFVPTELLLLRTSDGGISWSGPSTLTPPLVGPSFELCSPITVLSDGRWVLPTSTWPGWDGDCPNGIRMIGMVSHDQGATWPEYWNVMNEPEGQIFFWESKIIELADGRLMAIAWVYDADEAKDRPNHFSLSSDGGTTWSRPISTGIIGQTMTPYPLADGRVLSVYRRMDEPGLWADVARIENDQWVSESSAPLWGHQVGGLTSQSDDMVHNFNVLRFGAPCVTQLSDGALFVAFWCYEDCVSEVRWIKLRVESVIAG